jgi:hypothetical protein
MPRLRGRSHFGAASYILEFGGFCAAGISNRVYIKEYLPSKKISIAKFEKVFKTC